MTFKVAFSHDQVVYRNINVYHKTTPRAIRNALRISGTKLKRSANNAILHEKKRGRIYRVRTGTGRTRRHRSSAPGQSHANITGMLRRSLGWKVRGSKQLEFGYGADSDSAPVYGRFLEFGTVKMKARPTLKNALNSERRNIMRTLKREARKVL